MPEPILTAEAIIANAIVTALTAHVGTFNGRPKAYYQLAEQGAPLPFVVFQFQSDIGRVDRIGGVGATALITLKALSDSASAARALLATAAPSLATLTATGYTLKARYVRSPIIPPIGGVYQSAHIYRLTIERNP
jgi:hypothetical protein